MTAISLVITNKTGTTGTFFFRFVAASSDVTNFNLANVGIGTECTGLLACNQSGAGVYTRYQEVANNASVTYTIPTAGPGLNEGEIDSGIVWFVPASLYNNVQNFEAAPKIAQSEITATKTILSFDNTYVNGIDYGIKTEWAPGGGNPGALIFDGAPATLQPASAILRATNNNSVSNTNSNFTNAHALVADKFRETGTSLGGVIFTSGALELAACPTSAACKINACRRFMKNLNTETGIALTDTYCGWLKAGGSQSYCWGYDELECTDNKCGYFDSGTTAPLTPAQLGYGQPFFYSAGTPVISGGTINDLNTYNCSPELDIPGIGFIGTFSSGGYNATLTDYSCGKKGPIETGYVMLGGLNYHGTASPFTKPGAPDNFLPGITSAGPAPPGLFAQFTPPVQQNQMWWWNSAGTPGQNYGCDDMIVNGDVTNPQRDRYAGTITVTYSDISNLLDGIPNPPPPPPPGPPTPAPAPVPATPLNTALKFTAAAVAAAIIGGGLYALFPNPSGSGAAAAGLAAAALVIAIVVLILLLR